MTDRYQEQLSRFLGPLELRIMQDIWEHGPSTVNDVLDRLNAATRRSLAYNTVMSTLARLADKSYLDRHRDGKAYVYQGDGPEAFLQQQAARATRDLVEDLGRLGVAGIVDGLRADAKTRRLMDELLQDVEGG
jgi:predicted transcriptional regulator